MTPLFDCAGTGFPNANLAFEQAADTARRETAAALTSTVTAAVVSWRGRLLRVDVTA